MIELFGFLGGAIGVGAGLPQVYKILKLKHAEGLNLSSWMLIFSGSTAWAGYGVRIDSISAVTTNVIAGFINSFILFKIMTHPIRFLIPLYATFLYFSVLTIPESLLSTFLIGLTFAQLPQVISSMENYRRNRKSAVSIGTVSAALASYLCWATYGFLSGLPTVWLTSGIGFTLSFLILILEVSVLRGKLPLKMRSH